MATLAESFLADLEDLSDDDEPQAQDGGSEEAEEGPDDEVGARVERALPGRIVLFIDHGTAQQRHGQGAAGGR